MRQHLRTILIGSTLFMLNMPNFLRVKNVEIFNTKEFLAKIVRLWRSARGELFHQIVESLIYSPTPSVTTHQSHPNSFSETFFRFSL